MWVKTISDLALVPPAKFKIWMLKPGNLGESLRKVCDNLSVRVLEQHLRRPLPDECAPLGLNDENTMCFLRQIFLEGDGIPFTYGRVVVPLSAYLKHMNDLDSLGTRLIGETLLYNPRTTREAFEFKNISMEHPLFEQITHSLPETSCLPSNFWARRSLFRMKHVDPLLLTEVFLGDIPLFPS